jgi:hypothetical protein
MAPRRASHSTPWRRTIPPQASPVASSARGYWTEMGTRQLRHPPQEDPSQDGEVVPPPDGCPAPGAPGGGGDHRLVHGPAEGADVQEGPDGEAEEPRHQGRDPGVQDHGEVLWGRGGGGSWAGPRAQRRRAPATAAFRDSARDARGRATTLRAAARRAGRGPAPSFPTTSAHPAGAHREAGGRPRMSSPPASATTRATSSRWRNRRSSSSLHRRTGRRKTSPAEARTALGFQGSTVPSRATTAWAPRATADRTRAPAFPGSWTASRTRIRRGEGGGRGEGGAGLLHHGQDPLGGLGVRQPAQHLRGHLHHLHPRA